MFLFEAESYKIKPLPIYKFSLQFVIVEVTALCEIGLYKNGKSYVYSNRADYINISNSRISK